MQPSIAAENTRQRIINEILYVVVFLEYSSNKTTRNVEV